MKGILNRIAGLALLLSACQQVELPVELESVSELEFTAQIEAFDAQTKTAMDGNSVVWNAGDQIAIFQGLSTADKYQVKEDGVGNRSATFEIVAKGEGSNATNLPANVAIYPYESDIVCTPIKAENGSVNSYQILGVTIPSTQTYAAGSFANGSFLMAAITNGKEDHALKFKNVCGVLKLQLKGTAKIKSIELKGNDNEPLSGEATVIVYPDGSAPTIEMAADASRAITLDCGEGVQLSEDTAIPFLITIPPTVFEKGFTATVTSIDGGVDILTTSKSNTVQRSYIHTMPECTIETTTAKNKSISILSIGNSFSADAMTYLWDMLRQVGYDEVYLGYLYIGSCSLEKHSNNFQANSSSYTYYTNSLGTWNNVTSYAPIGALEDEDWDYIAMQQNSGNSGLPSSYEPHLSTLISIVKEYCPDSELIWHMTWAYQANSTHRDFVNYDNDQMTMYNGIISAVQNVILKNGEFKKVIPNGTSVQNLRTSYMGDNLTRDGYHLSYNNGRFLASMTFAKALTGCNLNDITYRPSSYSYSEKEIAAIIEAANCACTNPYEVTVSSYTSDADNGDRDYAKAALTDIISWEGYDVEMYVQLEIPFSEHAFYNSTDTQYISTLITKDNSDRTNLPQYIASPIYDRTDLPEGTLIVQRSGQQYRPEGWVALEQYNSGSKRPGEKTQNIVVVDDNWWGDWNYRAFNISKANKPDLTCVDIEDVKAGFGIFIPKSKVHHVNTPYNFADKKAFFFGDSITYGYIKNADGTASRATKGGYPGFFSKAVGLTHTNYGVSGSLFGTYNNLGRIGDKIKNRSLDCDFLFIAGGINDWQCGVSLSDFRQAVEEVCSYLDTNFDGEVIFITPINHSGRKPLVEPVAQVQDYRNIITEVALSYDFSVVQGGLFGFPTTDSPEEEKTLMFCDNLHPTQYGYEYYANCLTEVLGE